MKFSTNINFKNLFDPKKTETVAKAPKITTSKNLTILPSFFKRKGIDLEKEKDNG